MSIQSDARLRANAVALPVKARRGESLMGNGGSYVSAEGKRFIASSHGPAAYDCSLHRGNASFQVQKLVEHRARLMIQRNRALLKGNDYRAAKLAARIVICEARVLELLGVVGETQSSIATTA